MALALLLFATSLVNDVRTLMVRQDFPAAERLTKSYRSQMGNTPELAAAISWMARGALEQKKLDQADNYATQTRQLSLELLKTRKLTADPLLPIALGASIEVHAQVLAARGERPEAVGFLRQQLAAYGTGEVAERIRKNINLLNLEGKPAPALEASEWLGGKPTTLASLRGHPVLLFFWAHWCSDCKGEAAILSSMMKTYGPQGLTVIAPTKLYGYAAGGEDAAPVTEKRYIQQVRQQFYPGLSNTPIPLSDANFLTYGASSTPTIVLIDRAGVVRYYHPGAVPEAELASRIQKTLRN